MWDALADINSIENWNPGVRTSYVLTEAASGLGAKRRCDLGGRKILEEPVVVFAEHEQLTMRIDDSNLPFARAEIRFDLERRGERTEVAVTPEYALRFGPLGRLMDRLFVGRAYRKGMAALHAGLKRHVEGGSPP